MTTTQAAGGGYDYATNNGADWPDIVYNDGSVNYCGEANQSPINLKRNGGYPVYDADDDMVTKTYTNQFDVEVKELSDTTKVTLNNDVTNTYHSMLA